VYMRKLLNIFISLFIATGLVVSGGLYDVYAETSDYEVQITEVAKTEVTPVEPKKIEAVVEEITQSTEPVYTAPVATTTPVYTAPIAQNTGPDLSNHLEMPSIGVNSAVQWVGLNSKGEIDVPASSVGMWNGGVSPGQNGVVFLDGHVFGVFSNLRNTPVGSEFSLTWGGVVYRYRVSQNSTYALSDLNNTSNGIWRGILYTPVGGTKGLNIMTCAGYPQGSTYSHRTVVYAYQIN